MYETIVGYRQYGVDISCITEYIFKRQKCDLKDTDSDPHLKDYNCGVN